MLSGHMAGAVNLINLGGPGQTAAGKPIGSGRTLPGSPPERLKTDKQTSNAQMDPLRRGLRVSGGTGFQEEKTPDPKIFTRLPSQVT